jgi:hypothetical protein
MDDFTLSAPLNGNASMSQMVEDIMDTIIKFPALHAERPIYIVRPTATATRRVSSTNSA